MRLTLKVLACPFTLAPVRRLTFVNQKQAQIHSQRQRLKKQMSRLTLIRFGTYAILLICIFFAEKRRYFIDLRLPPKMLDGDPFEDPDVRHHGGLSPTMLPGFADTRLSGSEVLRLATAKILAEGMRMEDYETPRIDLQLVGARLRWAVRWHRVIVSPDLLGVFVDDATKDTRLEDYE